MDYSTQALQQVDAAVSSIPSGNLDKQASKRVNIVTLRMVRESSFLGPRQVKCAADAVEVARPFFLSDADRETMIVIALDTKHHPTCVHEVSVGSLDATIVHPREIFKTALLANASGIICLHNHPSGDPTPSIEDLAVTKRLQDAGKLLGVELIDHIVVGNGRFESLKAGGLM